MSFIKKYGPALLLLLPLFGIGLWDRHDWGDDFAHYLIQARNIVEHRPQTDNSLVFPAGHAFAVSAYPVGFPLMLAPLYALFKLSMLPYMILLTSLLIGTGLLLVHRFRQQYPPVIATLMSLWFCYNQYVMEWKWNVLSDLPFLFLCYCFLGFFRSKTYYSKVSLVGWGVFGAFIASVRIIGWSLPIAAAATIVLERPLSKTGIKERLKSAAILLCVAMLFFFGLNQLLFGIPLNEFGGFYSNAVREHDAAFLINLDFYKQLASFCFPYPSGKDALPFWWILAAILVWSIRFFRERRFSEWFFLIYGLVLLFYPYQQGGLRFMLPLMPLMIGYLVDAATWMMKRVDKRVSTAVLFIALSVMAAGCKEFVIRIIHTPSTAIQGPEDPGARELLAYIRSAVPDTAVIVSCKPRAIALYSGRKATGLVNGISMEQTESDFFEVGADYIIEPKVAIDNEIYNDQLVRYLDRYRDKYVIAFENADFRLLRRRT